MKNSILNKIFNKNYPKFGNVRSHAMNHSRRTWKANLQEVTLFLPNKKKQKVKIPARLLKTINRDYSSFFGCKKQK